MPDSVVARVADRLDIQPEQTDQVLRTLARLIKKQSARDGRVRVPGLGIFQQTTDALTFEPDAALSEAVNRRFLGLDPVQLTLPPETVDAETEAMAETEADVEEAPVAQEEIAEAEIEEAALVDVVVSEEAALVDVVIDEEEPAAEVVVTGEDLANDGPITEQETVTIEEVADEEPVVEEAVAQDEPDADETVEGEADADERVAEVEHAEDEEAEQETEVLAVASPLPEGDFDDPDISEAAAYAQWQAATEPAEDDTLPAAELPDAGWSRDDFDDVFEEVDETPEADDLFEEGGEEEPADEAAAPPEPIVPAEDVDEETEAEPTAATALDPSADRPPQPPPVRHQQLQASPKRRSALPWILLVTAVIVIGSTLYVTLGPPSRTTTSDTPPVAAEDPPPAEAVETSTAQDPEIAPEDTTSETTAAAEPATTPSPELSAEPTTPAGRIDLTRGGYTLVVASNTRQDAAAAEAERLRQRLNDPSLPVDVLAQESDGTTRYRVVVGQVATTDEAVALKNRHSTILPNDAWPTNIARITSDG